jgi:hypothetical protein
MFWQAATIRRILGVAMPAANLETALLQICVEGLQWDEVAPLQWIADAAILVRRCPLDWGRLIDLARAHRKVHTLREALGFLNAEMHIAIPAGPLSALRAEPADPTEIEELALALAAPRPSDVVALLRGLRTLHRKEARWRSQAAGWLDFRRFLLRRWGNGVRAGLTRLALAKLYATLARRGG